MTRPRVLMVTGVYAPEHSGASLQCRSLIRALADRVDFSVLTTSSDPALPWQSIIDDIPVRRVTVDPDSRVSKAIATERMSSSFFELASGIDIVHLHGFSQKSMLVIALAKLWGKRIVTKLTSIGHDDPESIRANGDVMWATYRQTDRFIGVTPRFAAGFAPTGLDPAQFRFIPNGVDLDRFTPVSGEVKAELRQQLGIPHGDLVVLFVGFFSREKNPDVLFDAWLALRQQGQRSTLVLVGATKGTYYEIDPSLADRIKERAVRHNVSDQLVFIESTDRIDHCYKAADVFALPTSREGLPNVLLEAMATGVPPVITRLEGVTDWIVTPGVTGELVASVDSKAFAEAIGALLSSSERRAQIGAAARAHVAAHFSIASTAQQTFEVYQDLMKDNQ